MAEPKDRRDFDTMWFGPAQAVKPRGDSTWRVSFAGGMKGRVEEDDGLFHSIYMAHGHDAHVDCQLWPSLGEAVEALIEED